MFIVPSFYVTVVVLNSIGFGFNVVAIIIQLIRRGLLWLIVTVYLGAVVTLGGPRASGGNRLVGSTIPLSHGLNYQDSIDLKDV